MSCFKQLKSKLKSNNMNKTSFLKAFDDQFKYLSGEELSQEFEQYNYNNICLTNPSFCSDRASANSLRSLGPCPFFVAKATLLMN